MSDSEHIAHEPINGIFTDLGEATLVPPKWLIEDLLPPGLVFIGAPPKSYKSTFTMAVAALVAGYDCRALPTFLSNVKNGGPVLAFSYEATAGELRHMMEVGLGCKVRADEGILVCDDPWAFRLDDPDGQSKLLFWLQELDPRLVILDPLRDFHQLEEKDSGGMNRMLRPLRQWAVQHDSCVMIVHHTKKREDDGAAGYSNNDLRGTSALFGIADGVIMLTPRSGQTVIKATFKRAAGWERTITIAAYDKVGQVSTEQLTDTAKLVQKALHAGATTVKAIQLQVHANPDIILKGLNQLVRNGLATRHGKEFHAVERRTA